LLLFFKKEGLASCFSEPFKESDLQDQDEHGGSRRGRRLAALALVLALAGCKLVDQTTFGVAAQPPAPDQLTEALRRGSGVPLVVVRYDGAEVAYDQALHDAVDLAEARKPDVAYDVVTVVPAKGTPDQQIAAAEQAQHDATDVMDKMVDIGVRPERVHLATRTDPSITAHEIRIYVH